MNLSHLKEVSQFKRSEVDKNGVPDVSRGIENTLVVSTYVSLGFPNWAVLVEVPLVETYDPLVRELLYTTLIVLFAGIFALVSGIYFSRRITRELIVLTQAAEEIRQGKLDTKIEITAKNEIGKLGTSFNSMAERLREMYTDMDQRIREKTAALSIQVSEAEKSRSAILNILEDERALEEQLTKHSEELEVVNEKVIQEKEKSEAILRFLKSIGEGIFATDAEGKIIFMNQAAEDMVGKSFSDVENKDADSVFSFIQSIKAEQSPLSLVAQTLKKAHHTSFPLQSFLVQKKKQIPVSGTCSIIRDPEGNVIGTITVLQDVTKKHELDQMKDSFLSVAAHQLRTPLGSMRWSMELLLNDDLGKLPKDAKEAVSQIYENSDRMIALVNDLLDVSRIDQNRGIEKKESVDVVSVLEAVIRVMSPEAEKNTIQINLVVKNKPISAIMAPPKHLHEAFENLLSNSIKYNKKGGSVTITVSQDAKAIFIVIVDTGIGIPKEDQSKIFSKFFRASNAVLKQTDGSGLGLSVVKSYLEEANAKVSFKSQENKGSTFSILFPLKPTDS